MSPVLRWTRALLLAGVALSTGTLAHASAGGLLPGPLAMTLLLAAGTCACASLLAHPASRARVVLLVVFGQSLVHVVLTALSGHRGDAVAAAVAPLPRAAGPRTGSYFDQTMPPLSSIELSAPTWVTHLLADLTGPHALMAVAHLGAAALVGFWLASGERALADLLQLALRRPLPELRLPAPRPRLVGPWRERTPTPRMWHSGVSGRGPPDSFA